MTDPLTTARMRALEAQAIASGTVTGLELMERAGRGVVKAIFDTWPDLPADSRRAVIVCGPGNNGGDGFVVARLLKQAGWQVKVALYGDPARLPPDAKTNHDRWCEIGEVSPFPPDSYQPYIEFYRDGAIFVDALFGIGLTRPLSFELFTSVSGLVENTFAYEWRVVAVDIPSGLDADTGQLLREGAAHPGIAAAADLTVTFHAPKAGHLLQDGPGVCGELVVVDIGLGEWDGASGSAE